VTDISSFFTRNIIAVYFFYGLSFFSMGLAVLLERGHSSKLDFSLALQPLGVFGLVHGSHEWLEMFLLIYPQVTTNPQNQWLPTLRVILLAISFMSLVLFGARLLAGPRSGRMQLGMLLVVTFLWLAGLTWVNSAHLSGMNRLTAADVYTRYSLAIPGAALTVWGLLVQRNRFIQQGMQGFGRDVAIAALAFGLYGGIGQLFASPSALFPSIFLNSDTFLRWFGFPIQVFRALTACVAAVFIIRSLRAFEVETRQQIEKLRAAQLDEQRRLEETRAELLHRTVKAQESERERIARELHDETGQTLTALGMGLRGLSDTILSNPQRAVQQASRLEELAVSGLDELQRIVTGLHPPQLDDLGLPAALRWYAGEIKSRFGLPVDLEFSGDLQDFTPEERTVFFRIAQEAITNAVRHAQASIVTLTLEADAQHARLRVQDDGQGFDAENALRRDRNRSNWGLLGMQERAALIGGVCRIKSQPGKGTLVEVSVRLNREQNAEHPTAPGG
jgi:signal transduction histidine kinase